MKTARISLAIGLSLATANSHAQMQDPVPASVHWAYSAYFGTGWYRVADDRDVFIIRMTPRWTLSDTSIAPDGDRTNGVYAKLPILVGLDRFEFDDPLGAVEVDNLSYFSVNPGIDIEFPVNDTWTLRPYASIGYGRALDGSESAWSYWGGVKSRLAFRAGKLNWRLLNQLGFVGYTPNDGPSDTIWPLMAALEFDHPMGRYADGNDALLAHWYFAYTFFGDDLDFVGDPTVNRRAPDQWEIGAAIGKRHAPIRIWFLSFDRMGLAYRASRDGQLKGVAFVFRSMFEE